MSAKGLEWALRLRADLTVRIEQLREALAGIEPLREELVRLEQQLKGVDRLVAAYHNQLGYPKKADEAAPASRPALSRAELTRQLEAALVPLHMPAPPQPVASSDDEGVVARARTTVLRLWLSLRIWFAEHFSHRSA